MVWSALFTRMPSAARYRYCIAFRLVPVAQHSEARPRPGNLMNLQKLVLARKSIIGEFPASMTRLTRLAYLDIGGNDLDPGPIPSFFAHFTLLEHLNLSNTRRCGEIPDWIGSLPKLRKLNLSDNQLVGSLPESLAQLSYLECLYIKNNPGLRGHIPLSLDTLPLLAGFRFDASQFNNVPVRLVSLSTQ
ncbi:hypothetical protein BC830DRAFT_1131008 [Chytriomyces sp. MP71]|nr:hypothetical protein BC830DRAFT_1131008 [Chytriomyces sp. MP71]